jgi:GntR family transcriptional repressor for pyruvate dehydrogenase complex
MEPLKKIRLSDQVYEAIKKLIEEERFEPGDKFYSENDLTGKLRVSRSSIREAVRILEVQGYVKVEHGKGIFISRNGENGGEAFSDWLEDHASSILEHFEVRLIIDPKAAAYAAKNAKADDIHKLEEVCAEFSARAENAGTAELIKIDEKFHTLLAKSTRNKTLYLLMRTMAKSLPEGWITSLHVPGRIEKTIKEHCSIVDAVKSRDPKKAEALMLRHLNNALSEIRGSTKKIKAGKKECP